MATGSLARRYARALVALAHESGDPKLVERFVADLDAVVRVLDLDGGKLRGAMENPGLTVAERRALLDRVLASVDLHDLSANFLRLLVDKRRFVALDPIRRELGALADGLAGRVRAVVTTARAADSGTRTRVERALSEATGKQVVVTYEVDADLIGGLVARVGDTYYDASVRARLVAVQESLLGESGGRETVGQA